MGTNMVKQETKDTRMPWPGAAARQHVSNLSLQHDDGSIVQHVYVHVLLRCLALQHMIYLPLHPHGEWEHCGPTHSPSQTPDVVQFNTLSYVFSHSSTAATNKCTLNKS